MCVLVVEYCPRDDPTNLLPQGIDCLGHFGNILQREQIVHLEQFLLGQANGTTGGEEALNVILLHLLVLASAQLLGHVGDGLGCERLDESGEGERARVRVRREVSE